MFIFYTNTLLMNKIIFTIFVLSIILTLLDSIFIYFFSNSEFNRVIFNIQKSKLNINYFGAILCYILLIFSLYYFIIKDNKSILDAFLLGIVIYGVFETTNYTIFEKWEPKVVFMDTLWGGILFASTTYITRKIMKYF